MTTIEKIFNTMMLVGMVVFTTGVVIALVELTQEVRGI
jgi:hypothetical protein